MQPAGGHYGLNLRPIDAVVIPDRVSSIDRRIAPQAGLASARRRPASTVFPNRDTSGGRASISPRDVWKFTMQALKANVSPTSAFDRKASPLFSTAVSRL